MGDVALNTRNWMYARCVTDDSDHFDGNGRFTGGHIKIIAKDADGTLTCWMYLERTGPAGQAAQNIGMVFKVHPSAGSLAIRKSSSMPGLTDGNPCYSLQGAEYTVYQAGTTNVAGVITTDASGYGRLDGLAAGNYDIVETKAPQGYLLDSTRHTVTVNGSATATYHHQDTPGNDPLMLLLVKQDAETGKAQGNARLEGAEYTVKYYAGNYSSDPAESGVKAKYTWVLATDAQGRLELNDAHKVSGDDFVTGLHGDPVLPVGTITIQETKAKAIC
ncbi:MAG: collagen binding domain-containing protein [Eisenbergiella sp.]